MQLSVGPKRLLFLLFEKEMHRNVQTYPDMSRHPSSEPNKSEKQWLAGREVEPLSFPISMQSLLFDGRTPGVCHWERAAGKEALLSTPRGTMIAGSVPLRHGLQLHELDASADASVQEPLQLEDKNRQRELRFRANSIES